MWPVTKIDLFFTQINSKLVFLSLTMIELKFRFLLLTIGRRFSLKCVTKFFFVVKQLNGN
jgi:hypothetical protein